MTSGEFILQCRDVEKAGEARDRPDWNWMCIIWQQIRSEMSKTLSGGESFYGSAVYGIWGLSDIVQNTAGAIHLDTMFYR